MSSRKSAKGKSNKSKRGGKSKTVKRVISVSNKRKKDYTSWNSQITKVLKQVHPDTGISNEARGVMQALINDSIKRIISVSNSLANSTGEKTVTSRNIQASIRSCLPGELAKHAVSEGTKSIVNFHSNTSGSQSARAGLQFSPSRIRTQIKKYSVLSRVGGDAQVYLAAVIEYLVAEVLELAGNAAKDNKKVRITPRHILLAIDNDEELNKLYRNVVIPGGVIPHIHAILIPKKKGKSKN